MVRPPSAYVESLQNLKIPHNIAALQRFNGKLGNLQRFIKDYQRKMKPFSALLHKDTSQVLTEKHHETFEEIKKELTKLTPPSLPSATGLGAMFKDNNDPNSPPIMYLSATLKGAQTKYSPTEVELFAIVYFVKKLRPYLLGRKFIVFSDHLNVY